MILFASCGGNSSGESGLTDKGIAPIILGAKLSKLPPRTEGIYESFEIIKFVDDLEYLEPRTYAQFKRDDKVVIEADLNLADSETIESIYIFDPSITYKGYGAGTPIPEILKSEAKLYICGNYESCDFWAFFRLDNIGFEFDYYNGKGFSKSGQTKLYKMESYELQEAIFSAPDFQPETKIDKIWIRPL